MNNAAQPQKGMNMAKKRTITAHKYPKTLHVKACEYDAGEISYSCETSVDSAAELSEGIDDTVAEYQLVRVVRVERTYSLTPVK